MKPSDTNLYEIIDRHRWLKWLSLQNQHSACWWNCAWRVCVVCVCVVCVCVHMTMSWNILSQINQTHQSLVSYNWWVFDIHTFYSLVNIKFASMCTCKNNRVWRHNANTKWLSDVTNQLMLLCGDVTTLPNPWQQWRYERSMIIFIGFTWNTVWETV